MQISRNYFCNHKKSLSQAEKYKIKSSNIIFKNTSYDEKFLKYENLYCETCGISFLHPKPNKKKLIKYYQQNYRKGQLKINNKQNKMKFDFEWLKFSSQRFKNFKKLMKKSKYKKIKNRDLIIDYGGYSGIFGYNLKKYYNCNVLNLEQDQNGRLMSENYFGVKTLDEKKLFKSNLLKKTKMISFVHSFEHLYNPIQLLKKISKKIKKNTYIYIEVPNLFAYPLINPTHIHSFSKKSLINIANYCGMEILGIEYNGIPKIGYDTDNDLNNISILLIKSSKNLIQTSYENYGKISRVNRILTFNYYFFSCKSLLKKILLNFNFLIKNVIKFILVQLQFLINLIK